MAEETGIEWADSTFNPWIGCQEAGPGCLNCYAATLSKARLGVTFGPGEARRRTAAATWKNPLKWQRQAPAFFAEHGRKRRVFCASLADVFDNAVDPQWRLDLGALIMQCPDLEWLLLTKRIGNALDMLIDMFPGGVPDNVRIGASLVNQTEVKRDLKKVRQVSVACKLKPFISAEPLLGPLAFFDADPIWMKYIGWVIVGTESGSKARHMDNLWASNIVSQCIGFGVPVLVKQISSGGSKPLKDLADFPSHLRIREFPA